MEFNSKNFPSLNGLLYSIDIKDVQKGEKEIIKVGSI